MITTEDPSGPPSATMADTVRLSLDAIDRGFVTRLTARACRGPAARVAVPRPAAAADPSDGSQRDRDLPAIDRLDVACVPAMMEMDHGAAGAPRPPAWLPPDPGPAGPLVDRLLHAAAGAWDAIARRIEDAHAGGASVIAVTGARRGEGRTTVVACLARALVGRGRCVEVRDRAPVDVWPRADAPIVIVDAGIWFPGGPIRRAWLAHQSLGCQAALLVRQAGQSPCPGRGEAIEAIGLALLGEVLTKVPMDRPTVAGG